MSRFARRADSNQAEIVSALRAVGAEVQHLYRIPGALDIIVGFRGRLFWAELKDGNGKLTDDERATIDRFARVGVTLPVWHSLDEALRTIGAVEE